MNKDRLSYIFLIVLGVSTLINILIYFTTIPEFIWRLNNYIVMFFIFFAMWKKRGIKEKDTLLTILGFIFAFVYFFTAIVLLIKFRF